MQLLEMTMPADFETQKGASLIYTTLEILEDIERSSDSILIRCTRPAPASKLLAPRLVMLFGLHGETAAAVHDAARVLTGGGRPPPMWSASRRTSSWSQPQAAQ